MKPLVTIAAIIMALFIDHAYPRDLGQWKDDDLSQWYKSLMQPDVPTSSCCGEADAYYCNDYTVRNGKPSCIINDDRPDEPRGRPHVENGTVIEIPDHKLKWDSGNPTGNGIVFMSRNRYVFCYVQPGGV